ncbi:MAG TPA: response regulator transcription factor [Gaiellaceae bacterium]|nr:response regulator transcription factor [Gaiellaceae bacterium]
MQKRPVRIVIADDHPLTLAGVKNALLADGDFEIVGETDDGERVVPLVGQTRPEVVLLDMHMPGMDGLACLDRVRAWYPAVKVVMMASSSDPSRVEAAFKRGACGYIVKTIAVRDLAPAIREAFQCTAYLAFGLPSLNHESVAHDAGLTERELEIVRAVARGSSNREIAQELWITEQTVKYHLTRIYRKLGVGNRTEAAKWAHEAGIQTNERAHLPAA